MSTKIVQPIKIYRQEARNGLMWDRVPGEESSQSYKAGSPLVRDASSGEIEEWAGGTDTSKLVGFAADDASETAGTKVPYYEANDYNLFSATMINGTDAYTLLGTEKGTAYSLVNSGDNWLVDVSDTTTPMVTVVDLIDAVSDVNPRCVCRVVGDKQANALLED